MQCCNISCYLGFTGMESKAVKARTLLSHRYMLILK